MFILWKLKQEGKSLCCFTLAANMYGRWLKFFTALHMSEDDCEGAASVDDCESATSAANKF